MPSAEPSPVPALDQAFDGHEQVTLFHDQATGLRAIVAIHSTALGPALGGTRMRPYPSTDAALVDVLALARAMTYKNALAGLDLGGGKAVIIGDPARDKTPELFGAYGRVVQALGGRYVTACDVGTTVHDMDVVAETCSYVTGRSPERGGAGDSGILTAFGVLQGMRAAVAHHFGETTTLAGLRVGVAGVGKVGRRLVDHLVREGATVCVTDPDGAAVAGVRERHPGVRAVGDVHELLADDLDVYSPNALGGAIDPETAATLSARVVCGGANNQLTDPDLAQVLADRGIVYAPDYLVNSGGVIQVADELQGYSEERARARVAQIYDTTLAVLRAADEAGETPLEAAERFARHRIAQSGSPDGRWPQRPDRAG